MIMSLFKISKELKVNRITMVLTAVFSLIIYFLTFSTSTVGDQFCYSFLDLGIFTFARGCHGVGTIISSYSGLLVSNTFPVASFIQAVLITILLSYLISYFIYSIFEKTVQRKPETL